MGLKIKLKYKLKIKSIHMFMKGITQAHSLVCSYREQGLMTHVMGLQFHADVVWKAGVKIWSPLLLENVPALEMPGKRRAKLPTYVLVSLP